MARMNIPNSLTMTRILMAPLLALAMQPGVAGWIAVAVFSAGMASDMVDGHLARSRGLITKFGTLMDPIADKLFVGTALVCLATTSRLAVWIVVVVFARDLIVTGLRFAARRRGVVIAANALGKAKTALQSVVVLVLLVAGAGGVVTDLLVYLMVAVTVLSGVVYAFGYLRGRRLPGPRASPAPAPAPAAASATPGRTRPALGQAAITRARP